jgi:hypothetical protein
MQSNGLDALEEGKTFSEPALMVSLTISEENADHQSVIISR